MYRHTWTGATDTDWSKGSNWSAFSPPGPTDDVTIPSGTPNDPEVPDTMTGANAAKCYSLNVESGATLTVNGELIMTGN